MSKIPPKYKKAFESAPELVKGQILEYLDKPKEYRDNVPLLWYILGGSTDFYKDTKENTEYTDESSGKQKCSNCKSLYKRIANGHWICSQIRGQIKPGGWCNQWKPYEK